MLTYEEIEKRRRIFLEKGFALFTEKGIDTVKLQDVADASGHGIATLYRYFNNKHEFLAEIAAHEWTAFFDHNRKRVPADGFAGSSAAEMFEFYLDSFLELYRNFRPLLRFSQFLNIYISSGESEGIVTEMYLGPMKAVEGFFARMYEKAAADHTLRTDIQAEEMFSTTFHLMLAAVSRYATGLVYQPEGVFDDMKELTIQKEMLWERYAVRK